MADTPKNRRSIEALANLLPGGVMGLSIALAAADAAAATTEAPAQDKSVAARLESLRGSVADAWKEAMEKSEPYVGVDPETKLAWWGNGWHNGGWRNGGWHNGGWGNGWHNGGWGNGGWGNGGIVGGILGGIFGSPWGNGWHNGFRNW
jgi:rSAM-associated Gly-rich repeat protein